MKKLNDELAKLLGIEPKEQTNCGLCPYGEDLDESDICPHYMADECNEIELIYPDFTSPYNFVKLLEIIINTFGTYTFVSSYCTMQEQFILEAIKFFNKYKTKVNDVIEQAQQTNWSY